MSIFEKELTVNQGINQARKEGNSYLVDIRSKEDFKAGHVRGTINIPLDRMDLIERRIPNKEAKIYLIGSHKNIPQKAKKLLKKMGYKDLVLSGRMEEHHGPLTKF